MQKKLLLFVNVLLISFLLVSCGAKYTVTFDSNGGTAVEAQELKKGAQAVEPAQPTRPNHTFVEWRLNGSKYDFNTKVTSNIRLVAEWKAIEPITISFDAAQTKIKMGEKVKLNVAVGGTSDKTYSFIVDHPELVKVNEKNELVVIAEPAIDTYVIVTAVANADKTKSVAKGFVVSAKVISGQVGELTSEMLQEFGNENITVSGTLTDYYTDFISPALSTKNVYDMTVEMADGAWYGKSNHQDTPEIISENNYRRGEKDGVLDQWGNTGHAMESLFVNKDNKVVQEPLLDYLSLPSVWESQHLWNHIGNLDVNKFTYDSEHKIYKYNADPNNIDDQYLMTYLSYSLTPLLEDTLVEFYLTIEDGKITKFFGQTAVIYYGADTREDAEAMSYSEFEISVSKVGTTKVTKPVPFDQPQYYDKLELALSNMRNATNYTFHLKENVVIRPSGNGGDYEVTGQSNNTLLAAGTGFKGNTVTKTGTVGCLGEITENEILLGKTGKYEYSMEDDRLYHTEYEGYKQIDQNSYDFFTWTQGHFEGKHNYKGNVSEILPTFNFSTAIFEYLGTEYDRLGRPVMQFKLRDTQIVRQVAEEITLRSYAHSAEANNLHNFILKIDESGNLLSAEFPYSIAHGVYLGFYAIDFFKVGSTELLTDTFEGYVPRTVPTNWQDMVSRYYRDTAGTGPTREENAEVALKAVFGEDYNTIPTPETFVNVFGDQLFGPFYEERENGADAAGDPIYTRYFVINTSSNNYDNNSRVLDYDEKVALFGTELGKLGYVKSSANSTVPGTVGPTADRYVTYIKDNIQIVLWNNGTKNFSIYLYKLGDWNLPK